MEKLIQKFSKREEKLKDEIKMAKEIKPDDVSKLALVTVNYTDGQDQTKEQRVQSMIAKHNYVQKMVKSFREQNKDWESWIESIIDLWKEKKDIRTGGNAVNRKTAKNDTEIVGETKSIKKTTLTKKIPGSEVSKKKIEVLKPKIVEDVDSEDNDSHVDSSNDSDSNEDIDNSSDIEDPKEEESVDGNNQDEVEDNVEEVIDDFFVGAVIKHKVIKRPANQDVGDEDAEQKLHYTDGGSFNRSKRFKDTNSNQVPMGPKMRFKTMDRSKDFEPRVGNHFGRSSDRVQIPIIKQPVTSASPQQVHPSWQAKQKEKMLIASSLSKPNQSKHIKFDD